MIAVGMQMNVGKVAIQRRALVAQPAQRAVAVPRFGARLPGRPLAPPRAGKDFDEVLLDVANKFEASSNKGAIVGWSVAAFFAITTAEWLIHLPLFDFLLGGPIQLLGILTAGHYGLKLYRGQKLDVVGELEEYVNDVSKELPGIGK